MDVKCSWPPHLISHFTRRQRDLFRQGFDRFLHGELIKPKIFGDVVTVRFYPLLDPPGRGNMAEKNDVQVNIYFEARLQLDPIKLGISTFSSLKYSYYFS